MKQNHHKAIVLFFCYCALCLNDRQGYSD